MLFLLLHVGSWCPQHRCGKGRDSAQSGPDTLVSTWHVARELLSDPLRYSAVSRGCLHGSTTRFDYQSFVVCLHIRQHESSNFVLFRDYSGYFIVGPWRFLGILGGFFVSAKKPHWDFNRDCIDSVGHFVCC